MKKTLLVVFGLALASQVKADSPVSLKPATVKFVTDNSIIVPDPIFDNQKTGLNWMVQPGCPADGKIHTVGGLKLVDPKNPQKSLCTSDQTENVKSYVSLVSTANFYYCVNHFSDPVCQ